MANRILYVITDLLVGGVPLHLLRLATRVKKSGWNVTVVSLKPNGPVGDRLAQAGISVKSCEVTRGFDFRAATRLRRIIRQEKPDVVHSFLFHANNAARLASLFGGFDRNRLICEIQTVEIERTWHLWVDRLTYRLCHTTVGNSPSVIDHLHTRASIPYQRLNLIWGGIDVDRVANASPLDRSSLGIADNETVLLWVGRIDPIKGLEALITVMARLKEISPVRLLLAGEGSHEQAIRQEVERLNVADCVTFLGRRDDVACLLQTADIFVFPSRTEGLPNAILEAMAARLPVVTTNVPGCRDLVSDGQTGLLVPPDDPRALAGAVCRLIDDKDLRKKLSDTAWHQVSQRFTNEKCHQAYLDLYQEVGGQS